MGRKTKSFSALTLVVSAGIAFTGIETGEAVAQQSLAEAQQAEDSASASSENAIEIVPETAPQDAPQPTVFVSREVVQDVPEESADELAAPVEARSLRELVGQLGRSDAQAPLSEEMHCLAGAVYFESRGEPLAGQLAVANVVINRSEDRRWPGSYCGVVYQRSQFSFVKNRRMPRINTASAAWRRAKAVARIAHEDMWASPADDAVYFHATYVRPRWSRVKTRLAQIDTHIFYR